MKKKTKNRKLLRNPHKTKSGLTKLRTNPNIIHAKIAVTIYICTLTLVPRIPFLILRN